MEIISCTHASQAREILSILNDAILNTTALYEYKPRTLASMADWFAEKEAGDFPVIGIEAGDVLAGFATYGVFRTRPAYKYSVEHSVYLRPEFQGKGFGTVLLQELIELARSQERHVMVGGIDSGNAASVALHSKLGFTHAGIIRQAAYKFGRWLDLSFYQLILDTPANPAED